jgi:pimeloyl-ACP methyl ester carboxylesterase
MIGKGYPFLKCYKQNLKMNRLFYLAIFLRCLSAEAQSSFYELLTLGSHSVGYTDTIIYNKNITYNEYNYRGSAPLFVQIWHPIKKLENRPLLNYGELRNNMLPDKLMEVYAALNNETDKSFINYNLTEDIINYDPIDYGDYNLADVLSLIKTHQTKSSYMPLKKDATFPVVLYHHGTQGLANENFLMAEYFASNGYVFISANFHLPYANTIFGLTESIKNDHSSINTVHQLAKSIAGNNKLFYVGHSWGAQVGWTYLHKTGLADAFVSMETTIERKKDTLEIKDKWPFVYDALRTNKNRYELPILMLANTQKNERFQFFDELQSNEIYHVTSIDNFEHESYHATFLMRYFYRNIFTMPDSELLDHQIDIYLRQLEMILDFINSKNQNKPFNKKAYLDKFYIN